MEDLSHQLRRYEIGLNNAREYSSPQRVKLGKLYAQKVVAKIDPHRDNQEARRIEDLAMLVVMNLVRKEKEFRKELK